MQVIFYFLHDYLKCILFVRDAGYFLVLVINVIFKCALENKLNLIFYYWHDKIHLFCSQKMKVIFYFFRKLAFYNKTEMWLFT